MKKRVLTLVLASALVAATVAGCGKLDGSEVVANGYLGDVPWKLSLDDIYAHLFDDRDYPYVKQYPVLYYTNETINIVPAN